MRILSGEPEDRVRKDVADVCKALGVLTADLHAALQADTDADAFRPEIVTMDDLDKWGREFERDAGRALTLLAGNKTTLGDAQSLADEVLDTVRDVQVIRPELSLHHRPLHKIRVHGDYHLGQTLKTRTGFVIIDFEGEPARSLAARREKTSPLKDVAGMLRSFDYALATAADADPVRLNPRRRSFDLRRPFLDAYFQQAAATGSMTVPESPGDRIAWVRFFELAKAFYELEYELNNRPTWARIPLAAILTGLRTTGG
jgi:maltose alpha-D-glucosyltransferase/alpha-amylase